MRLFLPPLSLLFLLLTPVHAQRPTPPAGGYQPFAGPFNTPIPPNPKLDPDSDKIVAAMMAQMRERIIGPIRAAAPPENGVLNIDYNVPVYFSDPSDPVYKIRCVATFAKCPLQDKLIHIPDFARPETSGPFSPSDKSDRHMAIIDRANGLEHDFWRATLPSGKGGDYEIAFGSSGSLNSQGIAIFSAVQAQYALTIGVIRAPDLEAGIIPHAIMFMAPCANDIGDTKKGVYPATTGSDQLCKTPGVQPYFGMRLQLPMTDAQIAALKAPAYLKTVYTALAHYGAYLSDTGTGTEGVDGELTLRVESGLTYTQIGLPDPWVELAQQNGIRAFGTPPERKLTFSLDVPGANIVQYLRVIAPCVTAQTC